MGLGDHVADEMDLAVRLGAERREEAADQARVIGGQPEHVSPRIAAVEEQTGGIDAHLRDAS